jgi:O-acetyl-ADP-ribose deacetylase (regulator of RNase III)
VKLILVDPNPDLCVAWRQRFEIQPDIEIRRGVFQDVTDANALVTAGNSFGLMDGGVDLAVARFDPGIETAVQRAIRNECCGELGVGAAVVVPFALYQEHAPHWLIYAPTMRVPMSIAGTDAVYRAMWAVLVAIHRHNELAQRNAPGWEIDSVIVPGLGTGAGRMPPTEAARQMALAWCNFNAVPDRMTWPMANNRHREIASNACCSAPAPAAVTV